jgi:hypothetical protein
VFKVGGGPHTDTFEPGDGGRYRTNVWDYAGINTRRCGRIEEFAPVKPVALSAGPVPR